MPAKKSPKAKSRAAMTDFPINDGTLPPNWSALDVVLIYWKLDTNQGTATVDEGSGVYDHGAVQNRYGSVAAFALAAGNNTLDSQLPSSDLAENPDAYHQPWDFAIARSCYVVFVLRDPDRTWIFQPTLKAINFKVRNPDGWYSDLLHIRKSDGATKHFAPNNCNACYFSARVEPIQDGGTDPFTIHFTFQQGPYYYPRDFDPAIKNKGHVGLFAIHIPTAFRVGAGRHDFDNTRKLLTENGKLKYV